MLQKQTFEMRRSGHLVSQKQRSVSSQASSLQNGRVQRRML